MFKNLKLARKLALGFGSVIIVTLVVALQGLYGTNAVNATLSDMYDNALTPIKDIANAHMQAIYHNRGLYDIAMENDPDERIRIRTGLEKNVHKMNQLMDKYRTTFLTDREKTLLDKLDQAWPPYAEAANKVVSLANAGDKKQALDVVNGPAASTFQVVDDIMSDLVDVNAQLAKQSYDQSNAIAHDVKMRTLLLTAIGLAVSAGLGYWIPRSMMSSRSEVGGEDKSGQLRRALRDMNASASSQIASGNLAQNCGHHFGHRRHRLPDQYPGAERGGRSGAYR